MKQEEFTILDYASSKQGIKNEWFSVIPEFDSSIDDGEELIYSNDFNEWYDNNKDSFEKFLSKKIYNATHDLKAIISKPLYRFITLTYNPISAIEKGKRDLGIHWSHKLNKHRMSFGFEDYDYNDKYDITDMPKNVYLFEGIVSPLSVNWFDTLTLYICLNDFENEIRLYKNKGHIKLNSISIIEENNKLVELDISSIDKINFKP